VPDNEDGSELAPQLPHGLVNMSQKLPTKQRLTLLFCNSALNHTHDPPVVNQHCVWSLRNDKRFLYSPRGINRDRSPHR
jgi:hypothetical protein